MFKKYFYLVRHGETVLNAKNIRQGASGGLSERGIKQVEEISKTLESVKFTNVFCSTFERTKETFDIINQKIHFPILKVDFTTLLVERRNPTQIIEKESDDLIVKNFINTMDKSYHDPNLKIYDEENFLDLKNRTLACQEYLIKKGGKTNLCITHGIFLKMFLATLVYKKDLLQSEYIKINEYNVADNAALTVVCYDSKKNFLNKILFFNSGINKKNNPWEILSYNNKPPNIKQNQTGVSTRI